MKRSAHSTVTRRSFVGLLGGAAAALYSPNAFASKTGSFERTLSLENIHTGERIRRVYWANGHYDSQTLREFDHVLRDHRSGEVHRIDRSLLDLLYALQRRLETGRPFQIICGYRSPVTNASLRRRSSGVARNSLHMEGMAVDVAVEDRSLHDLRGAALSLKGGGVGYYPKSGFVHVDVGDIRSW